MDCLRQAAPSLQTQINAVQQAPTLPQMIRAAWHLGLAVGLLVVHEVLVQRAKAPTPWPNCPHCGTPLHSKGMVPRQLTTILGVLRWKRRIARCPKHCKIGLLAPLDTELGLTPHQQTSGELKQLCCALAVFVPFATVTTLLDRFLPVAVCPAAIWHWVQEKGATAMAHLATALEQLAASQPPDPEPLPADSAAKPLVMGADGVMVPFRPTPGSPQGRIVWREVKVAILARLGQRTQRNGQEVVRLERRRLVAVLGDIDALAPRLWLEALRQGIQSAPLVVWLSDGGRGFWRFFTAYLAGKAIGVLDFYHAAQHLWEAAAAWLGGGTQPALEWFVKVRHQLRHGQATGVFEELVRALELDGLPAGAQDTLRKVYNYLDQHRAHLDYAKFKELGLPLGSGMVESACKWLIQQRFKGVGMRWSEDGFNHLLHLRLAWVNGRFDALFAPEASPNS
jgi:hypothetical protein